MTEQSGAKGTPAGAFDPLELPAIEVRLEELGRALDDVGQSTPFGIVALGFGQRARSLWLGLQHASVGPSQASVQVILRALVELTILLPWLALDRELHPRLWLAEAQHQMLKLLQKAPTHAGGYLAAGLAEVGTPERIAELELAISDARAAAITANVVGVGRGGSLVPNLDVMVKVIDTQAARIGPADRLTRNYDCSCRTRRRSRHDARKAPVQAIYSGARPSSASHASMRTRSMPYCIGNASPS